MRVPPFSLWMHRIRLGAIFLCGAIVGAAVFMSIVQHNFHLILEDNSRLTEENNKLKSDIVDLEKHKNSQTVIRSIDVRIEAEPGAKPLEEVIQNRIRHHVWEKLRDIWVGQKISVLDSGAQHVKSLYSQLIRDQDGKDYMVRISSLFVIYGELRVWIEVEEIKPGST
ncbi:hypothetical protein DUZ99_07220 [Xylanibacillus composti]|uniref:Sporulation membrane protein YtrI C-terminal domain-containing protein n=1 Tax=Xylanibacillus composti TaxID=1572762 RepID=A0A8J4H6M8_9BACL|nr:hypothetical protein [Xylanibacillus composti]MDT9724783.1 hypothetical protein [Xylanibacillus composti]GIQ69864.1 hypothetical protein XYCOK13_26880 [Xylanibacillus composti]